MNKQLIRNTLLSGLLLSAALATPALADLKEGDKAPDFTAQASLAGKAFNYTFKDALKKGPVVSISIPRPLPAAATCRPTPSPRTSTSLLLPGPP